MKLIPAFVLAYSDSGFTNPHEVVQPDDAQDCAGNFTHMGAKYSGIETKRHIATRVAGDCLEYHHENCNWLRIALKERSEITQLKVSTKWFTGNQVRAVSVILIDENTGQETQVLDWQDLDPDKDHEFNISKTIATEALFHLHYEGGISRIHFYGNPTEEKHTEKENLLKKATISHVSNEHYGHPKMAVIGERKEMHMLGWESARTGFGEQALFHLANSTIVKEVVVDTYLHRLNPPLSCHVFGLEVENEEAFKKSLHQIPVWKLVFSNGNEIIPPNFQEYMLHKKYMQEADFDNKAFRIQLHLESTSLWKPVLPFESLEADTYHRFKQFKNEGPFTHLLYLHYPNGGIHGLKVFGEELGE